VLRLTAAGRPVYSEVMAHFFADVQRRLYLRMVERMGKQVGMIDAEEWAGTGGRGVMGAVSALPMPRSRDLQPA
jgi:oxygen-independent coproporphyrinogen-3 oxidase